MDQLKIFDDTRELQPLQTYPGRKGSAWQQIVSQIPQCDLFIEAMAGSAVVSSKVKGCHIIVNDINAGLIDTIAYASPGITFSKSDYDELIEQHDNGNARRVFYFDPPYLFDTRKSKQRIYKHEWRDIDHTLFLKRIVKMKSPVMVSHYQCDLYDTALKQWRKINYNVMTHGGPVIESLYLNFPQPVILQCPDVAGENYTDRQRIKRKVERLLKRLQRESGQDRAVILTKVIDYFNKVQG